GIGRRTKKEKLQLDEIIRGVFSPFNFNGTWLSDSELLYTDFDGNLVLLNLDVQPLQAKIIVKNSVLQSNFVQKYSISPDRTYLLLVLDIKKLFRYTYYAKHKLHRIKDERLTALTPDPKRPNEDLQYASWGPRGTQLVFVHKQDIYYKRNATEKAIKIATSVEESVIYNGIPDWLYEEEILSSSNAIWWSPNGIKICYASFNDSEVDLMSFTTYGQYEDPNNLYPTIEQIRYPKPGRPNPTVKLWVYDISTGSTSQLIAPDEIKNTEHYFTTLNWLDDERVSVIWLKRVQNYSIVTICSPSNGWLCEKNFELTSKTDGWVEPYEAPVFTEDKKHYFLRIPSLQKSSGDYFKHIAKISVEGGSYEMITSGDFETTEILTYNPNFQILYYMSTLAGKPGERHIFGVNLTNKELKCLSCGDVNCLYNFAKFSEKAKYYVFGCMGPQVPKFELRNSRSNQFLVTLQSNELIKEKLAIKLLPRIKKFTVPLEGGFNASVELYIPPSLREDESTKYPLLIHVYGGPGSQQVNERFIISWGFYLSSRKNIIYGMIDGRGSGYKGDKLLHSLYRHLGTVEVEDQIAVTRYLSNELPFIDKSRIGIWGWSYGGYVTAMALASDNSVFSCGISVAPVSSWLYYDSAYTERFMGFPTSDDNYINYKKADVFRKTVNFKGKKFLLIHGTADDNVHMQQSMMLIKSLTRTGVLFQQQIYPDENHALLGVTQHLYHTMEAFLNDCFDLNALYDDVGLRKAKIPSRG
ncbi:prolyl endopeptidase FAP-like protein, partial [Dinothrombium tinctorium]